MLHYAVPNRPRGHRLGVDAHGERCCDCVRRCRVHAMDRREPDHVAIDLRYEAHFRIAQFFSALADDVEHWLDVRRRARDDAQDFADCGLLLEGFLGLVEKPHVVDRDGGLPREGLHQRHLVGGEKRWLTAKEKYAAVGAAFAHQRHRENRASTERKNTFLRVRIFGVEQRHHVRMVNRLAIESCASGDSRPLERNRSGRRRKRLTFERIVAHRPQNLAVDQQNARERGFAQLRSAFGDRVQHRLHVGGRTRDDTQDLANRRLLLESSLGLVEQPHILDRDRCLIGERLDKCDLLVGERLRFGAPKRNRADGALLAHQRHSQQRAESIFPLGHARVRIFGVEQGDDIGVMDSRAIDRCASDNDRSGQREGRVLLGNRHAPHAGREPQQFAVDKEYAGLRSVAETQRALGDRVEHRLHVSGRVRNDAKNFADRGLLFECLLGLVEQAHVVDRDRGLLRERLHDSDLVRREQSWLLAEQENRAVGAGLSHQRDG